MKSLTLLALVLSFVSFGQTDEQRLEKASFEITKNGALSFITHIQVNEEVTDLENIKDSYYNKEGIFYITFGESNKLIYIHHFELVDYNTIADLTKEILPGADVLYTAPTRIKDGLLVEVEQ